MSPSVLKVLTALAAVATGSGGASSASIPEFVGSVQPADIPAPSELAVVTRRESLLPNWVRFVEPADRGCYRKTYILRNCSVGYDFDNVAGCRAECPLNYPVECGMECIQQNGDCALHVIENIQAAANAALKSATSGIFGQLSAASAAVQLGVKCGQRLFAAVGDAVSFEEDLRTDFPNSTEEQIISLLNHSDIFVRDVPTAVSVCLGLDVPTDFMNVAARVVSVVDQVLIQVVEQGSALLSVDTFVTFIEAIGAGESVAALVPDDTQALLNLIGAGRTCGTELQSVINKVTQAVTAIKEADAESTANGIRATLGQSELFLREIPTVTNNCIKNNTDDAYTVRDQIRKALSMITDDLIDLADDEEDKALSVANYIAKVADMGLDVIAMFDPTGIASMLGEYVQPICGPTAFVGEIDDGTLPDALALTTEGDAFIGSDGNWANVGDGIVNVVFESSDTEDVTVVIHSAGEIIDDVSSGATVAWSSAMDILQNKAMYFDRWRPGFFGVAGSGGGSLVMWLASSSAGGHIELNAKINVS
jgi:hypothetical protein